LITRFLKSVLGILILSLALSASAQVPPKAKPVTAPDLAALQLDLSIRCSVASTRPRNEAEWVALVEGLGLRRKKNPESVWSVTTDVGELRALQYFLETSSYVGIFFFPASPERIPDPILAHWLKDARSTTLDLDRMDIALAGVETLTGGGTRSRTVSVSLGGGRLVAVRTQINWNEK
jgi:hypothetical protein